MLEKEREEIKIVGGRKGISGWVAVMVMKGGGGCDGKGGEKGRDVV